MTKVLIAPHAAWGTLAQLASLSDGARPGVSVCGVWGKSGMNAVRNYAGTVDEIQAGAERKD